MVGPLEILLVDDDKTDTELFARAVRQTGFKVHVQTVSDTSGGMEYLCGKGIYRNRAAFPFPDLVVLGLLQDSSGLDFLQWCRKKSAGKRLPLFVLTRAAEDDDRIDKALEYGATDVFFKTGTIGGLKHIVQELLGSLEGEQHSRTE